MHIAQVALLLRYQPFESFQGTLSYVPTDHLDPNVSSIPFALTEELARLGHEVTLFIGNGEATGCNQIVPNRLGSFSSTAPHDSSTHPFRLFTQVYRQAQEFDLIHWHIEDLSLPFLQLTDTPTVLTVHGCLDKPERRLLYSDYANSPLIAISNAQRTHIPRAYWVATIPYGLAPSIYRFQPCPGSALVCFGHTLSEPQLYRAIRISQQTRVPLFIGVPKDHRNRQHLEHLIRVCSAQQRVHFVEMFKERDRQRLLWMALALLYLDDAAPFSLDIIEALACGTPVIATQQSVASEIIDDGISGWLCNSEDRMIEAVKHAATFNRFACRQAFEQRFTAPFMARCYENAYQQLIESRFRHQELAI